MYTSILRMNTEIEGAGEGAKKKEKGGGMDLFPTVLLMMFNQGMRFLIDGYIHCHQYYKVRVM